MTAIFTEALLTVLGLVLVLLLITLLIGIILIPCILISKIKNYYEDKKHVKLREKYPEYYQTLDKYNAKLAETVQFKTINIDSKKQEIDELLNDIKYLPDAHVLDIQQRIAELKQEIFDNTLQYKKLQEEVESLNVQNFTYNFG